LTWAVAGRINKQELLDANTLEHHICPMQHSFSIPFPTQVSGLILPCHQNGAFKFPIHEEFAGHFTRIHRNAIVATKAIGGFERVPVNDATDAPGTDASGLDIDTNVPGMHWVCNIKGVPETLPLSRRQQHLIRGF